MPTEDEPWELAGIGLSCAWNPSSKYEVQGVFGWMHFTTPTYDNPSIIRQAVVEDWIPDSSLPLALGDAMTRSNWVRDAKLRIEQISGDDGVDVALVENALRAEEIRLEACAEQRAWFVGKQRLRIELRFDSSAQLLDARIVDGSIGVDADACVTSVLRSASWAGLPAADSVVTAELALRM